jgi:5'-nucleotidase
VPRPPLILITNDDGLLSPGLQAAAEALADLGELLLVAPATQQTSMSRAFTHGRGVGVIEQTEVQVGGSAVRGYAVTGSPALAVTHALLELADRPVTLCVSGVNYGENVGGSIGISGTVGAALEASTYGIPAIAVSITVDVGEWRSFGTLDWGPTRHFTRLLATQTLAEGMPDGVSVLNLNVPRTATSSTELRKTVQSHQPYYVRQRPGQPRPLDQPYHFPIEAVVDWDQLEPASDIYAVVHDQVASVTPLTRQMTADTAWQPRATSL